MLQHCRSQLCFHVQSGNIRATLNGRGGGGHRTRDIKGRLMWEKEKVDVGVHYSPQVTSTFMAKKKVQKKNKTFLS